MMAVVHPVTFIVLILATMFAIRIVRWAKITAPVRAWIVKKTGAESMLSYLAHCIYCLAPYIAAGIVISGYALWPNSIAVKTILITFAVAEAAPVLLDLHDAKTKGQ